MGLNEELLKNSVVIYVDKECEENPLHSVHMFTVEYLVVLENDCHGHGVGLLLRHSSFQGRMALAQLKLWSCGAALKCTDAVCLRGCS